MSSRFQHPPQFGDEADRPQVEDDIVGRIGLDREPKASDPVQRFLMLLGFALIGEQLIARQFDRRHVGHVFVVDDEIDRVVREEEGFGIGPGSQASPTALLGPLGL